MSPFARAFTPTSNRRLNELIGFLLFVAAILLFLALVSYSPLDRSLNTAGPPPPSRPARNWVGMLLVFAPGMLGLLPWHLRWQHAIPIEGLLGRIVGDALIHWFNLAGAYLVCAAVLAIGLYLTTTFSFGALETWAPTRPPMATSFLTSTTSTRRCPGPGSGT